MESFIDSLAAFLLANITWSAIGEGNAPQIMIGDPGMSAPTGFPMIYLVPLWDNVTPYSGIDKDAYVVPILIIDDLHKYGPPIANANAAGTYEQPGYRYLMQYGQAVRAALRAGGAGITQEGIAATSNVPAITYVWLRVDNKVYRGVRLSFVVQQRRGRGGLPVT